MERAKEIVIASWLQSMSKVSPQRDRVGNYLFPQRNSVPLFGIRGPRQGCATSNNSMWTNCRALWLNKVDCISDNSMAHVNDGKFELGSEYAEFFVRR